MHITMSNVSKSFGKKTVISDMSLSVPPGEILCLLGPSGAGKTTAIRLLIGAIAADSGEIHFGGTKVPDLKLARHIGFMPQNDAMYDDLSGERNLQFFAGLYGMGTREAAPRIDEALALVELTGDRKKFVRHYSGGMKKRLSLAAALLHDPEVLLLDEPTVGIDPVLRRAIWNRLKGYKEAGKTVIVSTHVMDEVTECGKAALIYDGKLIRYDTVPALLAQTPGGKIEELFFQAAQEKGGGSV